MFFLLSILRSPMDFCVVELLMYFVHNGIFHMISRYDIHRQRENTHIFLIQHLGPIGKQRTWVFIHVHLDSLLWSVCVDWVCVLQFAVSTFSHFPQEHFPPSQLSFFSYINVSPLSPFFIYS